jgi:nitroimidazol reductase NimA-like FMN-containing flavoprotein (pyridoxamine 5'-phosphate oxidase superfamily)
MLPTDKSTVKRKPKRAIYNRKEIYKIIDSNSLCHIGFIHKNYPIVIPTTYGRVGDVLYIHGALVSRLLVKLEKGIPISVSIARETGLALARTATNHSMNYESVVIFGKGTLVADNDKKMALKSILDNVIKGRWEEVKEPTENELKGTKVIAISMDEVTGKRRDEGVGDKKSDRGEKVWAGIVPIIKKYGKPQPDEYLQKDFPISNSIKNLYK